MTNLSHSQHQRLAIPSEYADLNKPLLEELNLGKSQLLNKVDQTVTVKQIYSLLCKTGILKEAQEKMLFLERI